MNIDMNSLVKDCMERLQKEMLIMNHVNIILAGKTGVGKSTLINAMFREPLAAVGIGKPVTQGITMLSKEDFPLRIYDTRGLELSPTSQTDLKKEITDTIKQCLDTGNDDRFIHCIWYCINTASDRIEEEEINWIHELANYSYISVPVILVMTKSFSKKKAQNFKSWIEHKNLNIKAVVPLLAEEYEIDDSYTVGAYGCEHLVELTLELLPDSAKRAFVNAQSASIRTKVKYAKAIVNGCVATTFGEAFTPVPFADAFLLIPTQIGMIASITAVFGLQMDKAKLAAIFSSIIGTSSATLLGRSVTTNLLKFLPGAGTYIGGVINGSTAAAVTTALGTAYIQIMTLIARGELSESELNTKKTKERMHQIFKKEMKEKTPSLLRLKKYMTLKR